MIEIVRPRVDRQLVEQFRIEEGAAKHVGVGGAQDRQRMLEQLPIFSHADAAPAHEQRNRPDPFVRIRLDSLRGSQHGHGPMSQVVVQRGQGPVENPLGFVPGSSLLKNGLEDPSHEQRTPDVGVGLMKQQIPMELSVSDRKIFKSQPQYGPRLFAVVKSRNFSRQLVQPIVQNASQRRQGLAGIGSVRLDRIECLIQIQQELRIGRPRREVQIAQQFP